jgi:cytochrome P450
LGYRQGNPSTSSGRFTEHLPIAVLCTLMGVPRDDVPLFRSWLNDLSLLARVPLTPHMHRIDAALGGLRAYLTELIAVRRRQPGDDFVSELIEVQSTDARLTESELQGALLNLLFAGHDTTRYQLASVVQMLIEQRAWRQVGDDRGLVPAAVNETMRLQPALHILLRKAASDVVYRDLLIPAESLVAVNVFVANRDPDVFPDPHRFDLTRPNASRHLGFGHGGHLCLGHALARMEMAIGLEALLEHYPMMELAGEPVYEAEFSSMSGPEQLPVVGG